MRTLGIDIGSSSIKAVEIESVFSRYEIIDYYEVYRIGDEPLDAPLQRLLDQLPKRPERSAVLLPHRKSTYRNISLPTRDRRAIQQALPFELEDEVPFDLDEAIIDFAPLREQEKSTFLHAVVAPKSAISETLEILQKAGLEPDLLTTETWAYRVAFEKMAPKMETSGPQLWVQVGHERSVLVGFASGIPCFSKEVAYGGKNLNEVFEKNYRCLPEEADRKKREHAFFIGNPIPDEISEDQKKLALALYEPTQKLLQEIRFALLSIRTQTGQQTTLIHLSGPTVQIPGLRALIETEMQTPAVLCPSLTFLSPQNVHYSMDTDSRFFPAIACALAATDRNKGIQLRRGEFSYRNETQGLQIKKLTPLLATLGFWWIGTLINHSMHRTLLTNEIAEMETTIEKKAKAVFQLTSKQAIKQKLANRPQMILDLEKKSQANRIEHELAKPYALSPITILDRLSKAIPPNLVVDLLELKIGEVLPKSFIRETSVPVSMTLLITEPQLGPAIEKALGHHLAQIEAKPIEAATLKDGVTKAYKLVLTAQMKETK